MPKDKLSQMFDVSFKVADLAVMLALMASRNAREAMNCVTDSQVSIC